LDSFHYLKKDLELLPGEESEKMEELEESFRERDLEKASVIVNLSGFSEMPVEKFSGKVENIIEDLGPQEVEIGVEGLESAASLVDSKIYSDFQDKLEEKEFENPELVERKFLRGLSRYER
ncbi:MAG: hypothetical protein ABEK04_04425, partial [Candidatus Nanohalobium sp.]